MKSLAIFVFSLLQLNSCNQNVNSQEGIQKVIYEASARGFFYRIEITNVEITVQKDRYNSNPSKRPIKEAEWKSLLRDINFNLDNLSVMETSVVESTTDRAAIAELSILTNKETHTSSTFDHGSPPDKLKPLIAKILALAETVE